MGRRGPKPKSAAELAARGSGLAKTRLAQERAAAGRSPEHRAPPMPDWLHADAQAIWRELVPILERMEVITLADGAIVARYCQSLARYRRAQKVLNDGETFEGADGIPRPRPEVAIAKDMETTMRTLEDRLGLSPAARARVVTAAAFAPGAAPGTPVGANPAAPPAGDGGEPGQVIDGERFFGRG